MINLQMASLVLRSSDLTLNSTTQFGSCDQYRLTQTWYNINLRTLLGDMYDKYDLFNICLNTITTAVSYGNYGNSIDDRNVILKLSGLPFVNQTYSVKQGCNTNICPIASFFFPTFVTGGVTATQYFYSNNCFTFGKSQQSCNITLQYGRVKDDTLPLADVNSREFPAIVLLFDIIGVSKDNLTNSSTQEKINLK
jgi:hypothetical protein